MIKPIHSTTTTVHWVPNLCRFNSYVFRTICTGIFNAICECATILISTAVRIALVAIYLSIRNISSILVWFVVLVHFWPNSSAAILLRLLRNYNYYSFSDVYEYCWVAVAVLLLLLLALIAIGSAIVRHTSKWAVIDIGQHIRGSLAIRTVIILLHYCGQSV